MHRTNLTKALCAILLLVAIPASANESGGEGDNNGGDGGGDQVLFIRPTLMLSNGDSFRPSGIVINLDGTVVNGHGGAYHVELGKPVETRDEDKVDLGKIPLFGKLGVGQETTSSEFRGAEQVGGVYRFQDSIVVNPLPDAVHAALNGHISTAYLSNQGQTFVIDMSEDKRETEIPLLGDLPIVGQMFRVGDAYKKDNTLLILITPHIIDIDD